jgi:hypothetical protein
VDFDRKIGAAQFALHATDTGFRSDNLGQKAVHFQYVCGTEFYANTATFAVSFNDFQAWGTHYRTLLVNLLSMQLHDLPPIINKNIGHPIMFEPPECKFFRGYKRKR